MSRVTVVGLGPAGPDLVTAGTRAEIDRVPVRFLRTRRHPAAATVEPARSFDELYERAESIEEVYAGIVEALVAAADRDGEVLYAVPGSPRVAERSVELLLADGRADVVVHPALSFLDLAWVRLGVDPLTEGVSVIDGHDVAVAAAGRPGPLLVAQCDSAQALSDLKLAFDDGAAPREAIVLQRLGLPDESVRTLAWDDLDREVEVDHLTSVYVPAPVAPVAAEVVRLLEVGRALRERCPWDREQTHQSLLRYLLEESYEVIEAVEHLGADDAGYGHLEEELGDVLFQVVFHAAIAAEEGAFTFGDIARGITEKLVRRHPHVFGEVAVSGADEVVANWEAIKREEKGRTSAMDGVTTTLPALLLAADVAKRATRIGAGPPATPVPEEADGLGELLLGIVEGARRAGLDAEAALRAAALRLRDHARAVEEG